MALERYNCQTARYVPLASLPYGKLERTARFIITLTVLFLQSAHALYLKLPHLAGKPLNAVFILPCQIIDFLYGIVDLLYARAHLVQAARTDGKIVFYRLKPLDRPPPVFASRQKQARLKRSANRQDTLTTSL